MNTQMFSHFKKLIRFFLLLYFLPLLLLLSVVFVSSQMDISLAMFTRDPASIGRIHPFMGIVSNFGVILWTAAAAICLFNWALFRHGFNEVKFSKFLLYSGLLTTLLLFDDFFLLHEIIFPNIFAINEKIVFLIYGCLILCWIVAFKECILKTEFLILIIALCFFGLSMFIDMFQNHIQSFIGNSRILFEDGFKLLGITSWLGYFSRCCFSLHVKKTSTNCNW